MLIERCLGQTKDKGGAWIPWSLDRVTFAAFDGSLVNSRGEIG